MGNTRSTCCREEDDDEQNIFEQAEVLKLSGDTMFGAEVIKCNRDSTTSRGDEDDMMGTQTWSPFDVTFRDSRASLTNSLPIKYGGCRRKPVRHRSMTIRRPSPALPRGWSETVFDDESGDAMKSLSSLQAAEENDHVEKTDEEVQLILKAIQRHAMAQFPCCSSDLFREEMMKSAVKRKVPEGHKHEFKEDMGTTYFYIIDSGSMEAKAFHDVESHDGVDLETLSRGDAFGVLVSPSRYNMLTALEETMVWRVDRFKFQEVVEKAAEHQIAEYVGYLDGLDILNSLTPHEKQTVARQLSIVHYAQEEVVFRVGDESLTFYVLLDGAVDVLSDKDEFIVSIKASAKDNVINFFGDRSLLEPELRKYTVVVSSPTATMLEMDRDDFTMLLGPLKDIILRKRPATGPKQAYVKYLEGLSIFKSLTVFQKETLAQAMQGVSFAEGDVIFRCGDPATDFYVLLDGCLEVYFQGKYLKNITANAEKRQVEYFGDRALLDGEPRRWTVKTISQSARALKLDRDDFRKLLGSLEDIINKERPVITTKGKIAQKMLQPVGMIGCSKFGPIKLVTHQKSGDPYVLKTLGKGLIMKAEAQRNVLRQKDVILQLDYSPFLIHMYATYKDKESLYFLFEFAQGGSLAGVYEKQDLWGSNVHALFYVAGIVFGLQHVHKRRVIHRDIKPEHIMVSANGLPKIGGFAVSKFVSGKTYTISGTPEYMAPEILVGCGHSKGVDWWATGVLTFELMAGYPPFEAETPLGVYSKVMRGIDKIPFPQACTGDVGDFVHELVRNDPMQRLGMRPAQNNIKMHPWFVNSDFDWVSMKSQTLVAPYKPESEEPLDSFATVDPSTVPKQIPFRDDGSHWDFNFEKL